MICPMFANQSILYNKNLVALKYAVVKIYRVALAFSSSSSTSSFHSLWFNSCRFAYAAQNIMGDNGYCFCQAIECWTMEYNGLFQTLIFFHQFSLHFTWDMWNGSFITSAQLLNLKRYFADQHQQSEFPLVVTNFKECDHARVYSIWFWTVRHALCDVR